MTEIQSNSTENLSEKSINSELDKLKQNGYAKKTSELQVLYSSLDETQQNNIVKILNESFQVGCEEQGVDFFNTANKIA